MLYVRKSEDLPATERLGFHGSSVAIAASQGVHLPDLLGKGRSRNACICRFRALFTALAIPPGKAFSRRDQSPAIARFLLDALLPASLRRGR